MKTQFTSAATGHLSDEAVDDFLIGLASPESKVHLADCPLCRKKLHAFQTDLKTFNSASLSWSQSKPLLNLHPLVVHRTPRTLLSSTRLTPRWAMALAMLLLFGGAILRYRGDTNTRTGNIPLVAPITFDDEAQIAQDNQMLQAVEVALNDNESPLISGYHLSDSPHPSSKTHSESK